MMRKFSGTAPFLFGVFLYSVGFSWGTAPFLGAAPADKEFTVAAVQYEVELGDYRSTEVFASEMESLVAEAAARGARLVVFPEYINVFLTFSRESALLSEADSVAEGARLVFRSSGISGDSVRRAAGEGENGGRELGRKLHELLRRRSGAVRKDMNRIWGGLAQRHSVWIVAGSYFGADQTNGSRLYNRAVIYGPEGDVIHEQDKVFLTPFEKSLLGLSSAEIGDAETFLIDGWSCALTICRDSFFDEWNERFGNADLWIDIKANGEEYGEQTPALFAKALPERIGETGVPYGLTACLNGSFLDLLWEGPSSVIRYEESRSSEPEGEGGNGPGKGSGGWRYVRRAESAEEPEIVVAELSLPVDRTPD